MLQQPVAEHVHHLIDRLKRAGYETYVVGGAVRDLMMGRVPKDYDVTTEATPEEIRDLFGRRQAKIIGRRFRLVHLHFGHDIVEISTFRREPGDAPTAFTDRHGNHAGGVICHDNEYGTAREDAWRRDFTVNAIFYDPVADHLEDFTGMGIADLQNKRVRAIGDAAIRFREDPVRLLRALKLAGQYDFTLVPETESALFSSLPLIALSSRSRLSLELEKILHKPWSDAIFAAFHKYGFLAHYLPAFNECWDKPAGDYVRRLLAARNARLRSGAYRRDSMSLAVATAVLPLIEEAMGNPPGGLWNYTPGIEREIGEIIFQAFQPNTLPKRVVAGALTILLMQPRLCEMNIRARMLRHPRYWHARELMHLQNETQWRDPAMLDFWPTTEMPTYSQRDLEGGAEGGTRRRRSRRPRRRDAGGTA
jgi:poly(A) polymerase